jgi:hypothetical protein
MTAPQDQAAGDHTIPVALPAQLHEAGLEDWFAQRVRPLVGDEAEDCADGAWGGLGDGLSSDELDAVVTRMRRCAGAPERATLTMMVGWNAGYVAWALASAVLRDGVLVRASRPRALSVLRHPDGWCADARLGVAAEVAVAAGHPWCGRPGVETLPDRAALEAEAIAEIVRACTPIIDVLATRSRRGRAGLWAQIADSVGGAAYSLHDAEPQIPADTVIGATERLLHAPGAPWKQTPDLWLADAEGGPVLIKHRGSCCLYHRFDPAAREEQAPEEEEPDAAHLAYVARFGDEPPHYCATCLFRKPADVEARMVFHAERVRAGADVHELLSHSEDVERRGR